MSDVRFAPDPATARRTIPAFAAYGLELEYMIVDGDSLDVRPMAAELLGALALCETTDPLRATLGWSNEIVRHVVELKNTVPAPALDALPARFQQAVRRANAVLETRGARLMPTAMHPWMDPLRDTVLWKDDSGIYDAYHRIYDCRGHGWSNLQSVHINLPFADDAQFARLHAAARLVLPLLPALAASSPLADGRVTGMLDHRLQAYRSNCTRTPSVAGRVIPETVATRAEYETRILAPMYDELAPLDPDRVLRHEWLNSRGAIARFDRSALEIRLVDIQECPCADVAIACATIAVVESLYAERWSSLAEQRSIEVEPLERLLLAAIRDGDEAIVDDRQYLAALGIDEARLRAADVWRALVEATRDAAEADDRWWRSPIDLILARGPLARRILRACGADAPRGRLHDVYAELCDCLQQGRMFEGTACGR
jgi:glutamate---cysteine ligase / carboxylate-amine ligase